MVRNNCKVLAKRAKYTESLTKYEKQMNETAGQLKADDVKDIPLPEWVNVLDESYVGHEKVLMIWWPESSVVREGVEHDASTMVAFPGELEKGI